jgi:hypothetical protein
LSIEHDPRYAVDESGRGHPAVELEGGDELRVGGVSDVVKGERRAGRPELGRIARQRVDASVDLAEDQQPVARA